MTTELEEQFFKVFEIEPKQLKICRNINHCPNKYKICNDKCKNWCVIREDYPKITDRKLLEMVCVYNSFQNDEASLLVPFDINNVKDIALQVITKSIKDKSLNNYYCNDVEKLKSKIQQLFKEEE